MDRKPVAHRAAPAYPDRHGRSWALGLLALGSSLTSGALVGCEDPPATSPHTQGAEALPGEMPAVDGDMQVADPDPPVQPEPGVEPTIPELQSDPVLVGGDVRAPDPHAASDQPGPRMVGTMPEPGLEPDVEQAEEALPAHDDVPIPGGMRHPALPEPQPAPQPVPVPAPEG